jgi:hypothetical protein
VLKIFTSKPPGKVDRTQEVKLLGLPARDYVVKRNSSVTTELDFVTHVRLVAVGDRIYAIARTGAESLVDLEGARYIDTFRPTRK